MTSVPRIRFLGLAIAAAAALGGLVGCSGGSGSAAAPTSGASSRSSVSGSTPSSSTAGSSTPTAPASSSPAAAITSTPGNPEASIVGAPSLATLFQLVTSAAKPPYSVSTTGGTQPDGSIGYSAGHFDGLGGEYSIDFSVNPRDKTLITINCTSPVGTVDAVRDVCIDLKYSGSNPTTARAWVIAATRKIPAGNSTVRIRNENLNGLHWIAYLDSTGKNLTVSVSSRHLESVA